MTVHPGGDVRVCLLFFKKKSYGITKVITVHPEGDVIVCQIPVEKFH